jgi:subtilisin family serine protease
MKQGPHDASPRFFSQAVASGGLVLWLQRRPKPPAWLTPALSFVLAFSLPGSEIAFAGVAEASVSPPYRPDRILVQPKTETSLETLANFHSTNNAQVLWTLPSMGRLQVVSVPAGETVESLVRRYQQSGLVQFAEPDYFVQADAIPNDPKFLDGTQWGLNTIDAPGGWDIQTSASNIIVAVVDTGVWYTHQDLAGNMWVSPFDGSHGLNAITGTNDPNDLNGGHGTGVAGVLGAVSNNGLGIAGVAWTVQILACKSLNQVGVGSTSDCVTCIDYARTNNARIINASWGDTNSLALSNAVYSLREAGIILVAACGNIPTNVDVQPSYPACFPLDNVVSVASSMPDDTLAPKSNYGATNVDLAAPGANIYSTMAGSDTAYLAQSGTSFAAPFVSGTLALLLARFPDEPYQLTISRLLNGVDPIPALAGKCVTGGRLNLHKALSPPLSLSVTLTGPGRPVALHVNGGPNRTCILQAAPDLASWSPIFTNTTSSGGTYDFIDPASANLTTRFYRAVAAP